jgi:hypothetical protein
MALIIIELNSTQQNKVEFVPKVSKLLKNKLMDFGTRVVDKVKRNDKFLNEIRTEKDELIKWMVLLNDENGRLEFSPL